MRAFDDPSLSSPEERLAQTASLFANAILRRPTRARSAFDATRPSISTVPPPNTVSCLELPDKAALTVHNG